MYLIFYKTYAKLKTVILLNKKGIIMAQAKRKTATRTQKTMRQNQARRQTAARTHKKQQGITNQERFHVYLVTAMGMIAGILLCADVAMMIVK